MTDQPLEVIQKRAFRPQTTQIRQDQPVAPYRLKALPEPPQKRNEVWVLMLLIYLPNRKTGSILPGN